MPGSFCMTRVVQLCLGLQLQARLWAQLDLRLWVRSHWGPGSSSDSLTSARLRLPRLVLGRRPAAVSPPGSARPRGAWGRASSAVAVS